MNGLLSEPQSVGSNAGGVNYSPRDLLGAESLLRRALNRPLLNRLPYEQYIQNRFNPTLMQGKNLLSEALPVIGDAKAVGDAVKFANTGQPWLAALNAASVIPGVGDIGRIAGSALPFFAGMTRLGRAQQMGFMTDMPLYHGMAGPLEGGGFDLSRGGNVMGSPVGLLGVSAATDPSTAAEFASQAARKAGDASGESIVPLLHRAEKPAVIDLTGDELDMEMAATIQNAWDDGYDSLLIRNYTTPDGRKGNFVLVKDPSQLRSPHARFNLAEKLSPNLLAGTAAAAVGIGQIIPKDEQR